jgi:YtkA-like
MTRISASLVVIVILASGGCQRSNGPTEQLTEVGKVRSGTLDVVLLARDAALSKGKETATLEFRAASDGSLVDVGTVKASATMPMAGMAPMLGRVDVQPTGTPGRYLATSDLGMAGDWRLTLEWNGPGGRGSATFSPAVQ